MNPLLLKNKQSVICLCVIHGYSERVFSIEDRFNNNSVKIHRNAKLGGAKTLWFGLDKLNEQCFKGEKSNKNNKNSNKRYKNVSWSGRGFFFLFFLNNDERSIGVVRALVLRVRDDHSHGERRERAPSETEGQMRRRSRDWKGERHRGSVKQHHLLL